MNTEIQDKIQRDNETAIARILMAKNYLKLKNDVAKFVLIIENFYLTPGNETTKPCLKSIIESDLFQSIKNQTL